jgi:hypothetical protein
MPNVRLQAKERPEASTARAWLSVGTAATNRISFVWFEADFLSKATAQGQFTVYWNNEQVGVIDERQAAVGRQEYTFAITNVVHDKINVLGFHLSAPASTASIIAVTNVLTGFAGTDVPFTLSSLGFEPQRGFQLNLAGAAGHTYLLEASGNLASWQPVSVLVVTNAAPANATIQVVDPTATNFNFRFYRVVSP